MFKIKEYIITDTHIRYDKTDDFKKLKEEIQSAIDIKMKLGYPFGKDAEQCLIVYVIFKG